MNTALIPAPTQELTALQMNAIEQQLEQDKQSFQRMGANLIRVRDGKGYKLRGYKTFEDYCQKRWGITDRQGRRLIAGSETAEQVQRATGQVPANESVARVLTPIANDPIIIQKVAAKLDKKKTSIGTATAEQVDEAVRSVTGKAKAEPKPKSNGHKPAPAVAGDSGEAFRLLEILNSFLREVNTIADSAGGGDIRQKLRDAVKRTSEQAGAASTSTRATWAHEQVRSNPSPRTQTHAKAPTCKTCGKTAEPGARICPSCGGILR